jgi:sugar phosphate isomerase/epimerase
MEFAICNEIFQGWAFEDAAAFAAQAGYDALEIAPFTFAKYVTDISAAERQKIRETARRCGLSICGIHWVLAQTEGLQLTHSDAAVRQRTARYLSELVDFCADLRGGVMVVGSPKQRNLLPGVSAEQAWAWAAETFGEAARRAAERDIVICLEPLSPAETDFINTAAEAIRFVDQFHSRHFQIILDVKAMCAEAKPIPQIISESAGRFAHFHANDKNLKGPGFGEVDFVPIAAALRKTGYAGHVSVEVFNFDEGAEIIATKSIEYLKRVFGENQQNGG